MLVLVLVKESAEQQRPPCPEGAGEQVKPVYFWVLLSELPPGDTTHMYGEPFCLESDPRKALTRVTHSCLPFS